MKVRRSWHSELPLPGGERVGVRGFGPQSKNSDSRTPSSCPSPLWGEGTQRAGRDTPLVGEAIIPRAPERAARQCMPRDLYE